MKLRRQGNSNKLKKLVRLREGKGKYEKEKNIQKNEFCDGIDTVSDIMADSRSCTGSINGRKCNIEYRR